MRQVRIPHEVREECLDMAHQDYERFHTASNTLVLTDSHEQGIFRGLVGQWAVGQWLGVPWRVEPNNLAYDLMSKTGKRVDVKTTGYGNPLMVPLQQERKVDPERTDIFTLVWFGGRADYAEICGWIEVSCFRCRMKRSLPSEGRFPIPTLFVPVEELREVE